MREVVALPPLSVLKSAFYACQRFLLVMVLATAVVVVIATAMAVVIIAVIVVVRCW